MIRLYVIDDHVLILDGICMSLNIESDDFQVVGGSENVPDALTRITSEDVDIIILDLFIKQDDPIINIRKVREAFPKIPVVILSQESSLFWQIAMFTNGAVAYFNKGDDLSVTRTSLHRVAAHDRLVPEEVLKVILPATGEMPDTRFIQDLVAIIKDLSMGLTLKQIASKMDKSESALEKKLQTYRNLFQAKTNIELVCKVRSQFLYSIN